MVSASGLSTVSSKIDVTAGPPSQLSITTQPSASATAGVVFTQQPVIQLLDADGNTVSQSGVAITAAINTATGSGTLGGTTTVTTSGSGVATFSGLKISKTGSYTLRFTSPGLTQAVSITITVN
jgi:hypothetical protein